ncbi:MAG: thymidylate synthase [Deltaproteobacteria bacterium]|nr:thymidylate synthase [Deltaproteobacteria bacterium]
MQQYLELLKTIRSSGQMRSSRAKLRDGSQPRTQGIFGAQIRFDLRAGFPLVTTKKVTTNGFVTELLWFLKGDTNVRFLQEHKVSIWDEWADDNGELGPIYGAQWRRWSSADGPIDQLAGLISGLRRDPFGRRHILSSWNVGDVPKMKLPPCHLLSQFYVSDDRRLSCQLYQRSADMFLGVPWNIASYALLTHMVAQVVDLDVGDFVHTFGDAHIYENHFAAVDEQLKRQPHALPKVKLNGDVRDIDGFTHQHIAFEGYTHEPALKGEVAV